MSGAWHWSKAGLPGWPALLQQCAGGLLCTHAGTDEETAARDKRQQPGSIATPMRSIRTYRSSHNACQSQQLGVRDDCGCWAVVLLWKTSLHNVLPLCRTWQANGAPTTHPGDAWKPREPGTGCKGQAGLHLSRVRWFDVSLRVVET
jgi:hypothetical protein